MNSKTHLGPTSPSHRTLEGRSNFLVHVFGESRVGGRFSGAGGVGEVEETVVTDQLVHDHFGTSVVEECHRPPNLPRQLQGFKRRWYR